MGSTTINVISATRISNWLSLLPLMALVLAFEHWLSKRKRQIFPPGPKPLFLIGNLLDLPQRDAAMCYVEWQRQYNSKILHASCFGQHFIILNSLDDAEALLDKRANIYSDRPELPVIEAMGWLDNMSFMRQGPKWQRHRRLAQQNFRQDVVATYHPTQRSLVHKALHRLLTTPERFEVHNTILSIGIAMATMYGYVLHEDDPYINRVHQAADAAFRLMHPGFTLINMLPFLKFVPAWFPMARPQKMISKAKQLSDMLVNSPMECVKDKIKNGTAIPCIVSSLLERADFSKEGEDTIAGLAFTVFGAASDTTISATHTFLYLMVTHPEVQRKAQQEIDRVIGSDHPPDFRDRQSLPYIDAVYREVLRWKPPTSTGLLHRVKQDDTYKGYFIPEGTTIIANIWAMTRDESLYLDAASFKPERFLNSNGELIDDDRILTFGFGKRVCVGKHVASATLWITFASMLATFNMTKTEDSSGRVIEVNDEFDDPSLVVQKKPFKCSILPRSDASRRLIEEAVTQDNLTSLLEHK